MKIMNKTASKQPHTPQSTSNHQQLHKTCFKHSARSKALASTTACWTASQSTDARPITVNQPRNHAFNQQANLNRPTNPSTNRPTDRPASQPANQPTNQPTNKPASPADLGWGPLSLSQHPENKRPAAFPNLSHFPLPKTRSTTCSKNRNLYKGLPSTPPDSPPGLRGKKPAVRRYTATHSRTRSPDCPKNCGSALLAFLQTRRPSRLQIWQVTQRKWGRSSSYDTVQQ